MFKIFCCFFFLLLPPLIASAKPIHIESWYTQKGTKVLFVQSNYLPMVDIQINFRAGSAYDGSRYGLAQLTNNSLNAGAVNMNSTELAENFDQTGAIYTAEISRLSSSIHLRSLSAPETLEKALNTYIAILSQPNFPPTEISKLKAQQITAIQYEQQSPQKLAQNTFLAELYQSTPYSHNPLGNEKTVSALSVAEIKTFYQQHYTARNAVLNIVGNLSLVEAKMIAEKITEHLAEGVQLAFPDANIVMNASQQSINFPSEQSHIIAGNLGITENNPDYFSLIVGNYILGGGTLVSRLNQEVREKQGLSYTISSNFLAAPFRGPFSIYLQTANAQANQALAITQHTLKNFIEKGPSEAELKAAKDFIIGSFPLRLDNNSKILDNISYIGFYGLALDYLETYTHAVNQVSIEQIKTAFQKQFKDNPLIIITVGKANAKNAETQLKPS